MKIDVCLYIPVGWQFADFNTLLTMRALYITLCDDNACEWK